MQGTARTGFWPLQYTFRFHKTMKCNGQLSAGSQSVLYSEAACFTITAIQKLGTGWTVWNSFNNVLSTAIFKRVKRHVKTITPIKCET
jgi:hypothetical protein